MEQGFHDPGGYPGSGRITGEVGLHGPSQWGPVEEGVLKGFRKGRLTISSARMAPSVGDRKVKKVMMCKAGLVEMFPIYDDAGRPFPMSAFGSQEKVPGPEIPMANPTLHRNVDPQGTVESGQPVCGSGQMTSHPPARIDPVPLIPIGRPPFEVGENQDLQCRGLPEGQRFGHRCRK